MRIEAADIAQAAGNVKLASATGMRPRRVRPVHRRSVAWCDGMYLQNRRALVYLNTIAKLTLGALADRFVGAKTYHE